MTIIPIRVPMTVSASRVQIPMQTAVSRTQIGMKIGVAYTTVDAPVYDGELEVESILHDAQTLQTKNKLMPGNMVVRPITILDVDNPAGGYTVTIGRN